MAATNELSPAELKRLSLDQLLEIEVTTVTRRPSRLFTAASEVHVISQEDIRRSGARAIPEALRLAPNLQIAQIDSMKWAITARGQSANNGLANKLLVMIDGRSIYTPLFAGVFWEAQDILLEDVDRIEVISGPGATVWGANAVNGVINIITKHAKETQGALITGGAGNELEGFGSIRYGGQLSSNLFYRIYGKAFERDSTVFADGTDARDDWRMTQGGFRMDWDANAMNQLTFQGDLYQANADRITGDDTRFSGGNVVTRWKHEFEEQSNLDVTVYYDHTRYVTPGTFAEDLDTFDVDFQHQLRLTERNTLIWGAEYRLAKDVVHSGPSLAFYPEELTRQLFSGFVQNEFALVPDRLTVTLGTKLEHNDYTGFEVQPSLRAAWTPTDRNTVWGAVSRAVRTPSRVDRHLYAPADPPYFLQAGRDFRSEKLIAYELGYRGRPVDPLLHSVTLFYHDYDDIRSVERLNPPAATPIMVDNGLEGETYGVELSAILSVTEHWRLRAGYTYMQVRLRPQPWSNQTAGGSGEAHDPTHSAQLWSFLDLPRGFELDGGLRFVSKIKDHEVPAYAELTARLGWQTPIEGLDIAIIGQNLLDSQHPEFGARAGRHEIERSVFGKATWRF